MIGKDGLEKGLEGYLRGIDGVRAVEVNRTTGELITEYMLEDPDPGDTCVLTIDTELQEVTERALAETLQQLDSEREDSDRVEGGAAVVISVKTGEILAMASYPTYSLSTYVEDLAEKSADPLRPYYNRATMGLYSPGSTFKMATALAALEEGVITPKTTIKDEGVYMFYAPTYTPGCWIWNDYKRTHGTINVSDAIKYSCNYFFFETGRLLGIERLNKYAEMLGLGQKTGIELTDEKAGNLAGPESREKNGGAKWKPSETIQAAIGQTEQQFTPVQIASYIATLVSGGKRYQPHLLLSRTDGADGTVSDTPLDLLDYEFSKSSIEAIKKGMKGVVTEDGTASKYFRDFPIEVGGKTGSAQTQKDRSANGVFVSFAPYDDPEIAVCVVGEHAGSGGSVAPVCIAIYDRYFGLGLFEEEEPAPETPPAG
jgi:penicillin-binding protein 2